MGRAKDLKGQRFGRLTVVRQAGKNKQGNYMWFCQCDCGNTIVVISANLNSGRVTSCGCSRVDELIGQKFGRLTVIKRAGSKCKNRGVAWLCKCECGNEKIVMARSLKSGVTTSCGCWHNEKAKEIMKKLSEEQWQDENFKQMQSEKRKGNKSNFWKGGITPISRHLRNLNESWFEDCKQQANYTCQLTGKVGGNLHTHHLKAFSTIVLEAHNLHNIEIKPQVKDYTKEELKLLEEYVASWHKDNSNAVVLNEEVHDLFHKEYGKGENTSQQYEEFKQRYLNGEFNN